MFEPMSIAGVEIRRDHEGRFCINDLHRASGGSKRHQPSNWQALQQTQALIGAIERAALDPLSQVQVTPIASRQGVGTFGVKSLVYSYAMWVSPEFNLKVIEAYDAMQMAKYDQAPTQSAPALPDFTDPIAAARAWADEAEKVKVLAELSHEQGAYLEAAQPALEFHEAVANSRDSLTIGQFAKLMGTGEVRLFGLLRNEKVLISGGARHNLPFQQHIDAGRFRVNESVYKDAAGNSHLRFQTRLTPKGQMWLQKRFFPSMSNAFNVTPDMFAPPLPLVMPVERRPAHLSAPAPRAPAAAPAVANVHAEIAKVRELRQKLVGLAAVSGQQRALASALARPETPAEAGAYGRRPIPLPRDPMGSLAHPDHEAEAQREYQRNPGSSVRRLGNGM